MRRLTDLGAVLSLASDLAHGAPSEHQLRVAVLASRSAVHLGLAPADRADAFDAALLRWLGCTATAQPLSSWVGDEIAAHRRGAHFHRPLDPLLEIVRHAGAGLPAVQRAGVLIGALREGPGVVFGSTCEVGTRLAERLGYGAGVVDALGTAFERHDGKGWPGRLAGDGIPVAARVAAAAEDLVTLADFLGLDGATAALRERAGHAHDPEVVDATLRVCRAAYADLDCGDAMATLRDADPTTPARVLPDESVVEALLVVADYVDLKVPTWAGHSRAVADLAGAAAASMGLPEADDLHRAALVHDLGRVGVPNPVWNRPGPLSSAERDLVELCPHHTQRLLARCDWLAPLGRLAAESHERLDGSGHPHGLAGPALSRSSRVLQAADHFRGLLEDRPYRPAVTAERAAAALRTGARDGRFDPDAVEAVVRAAGGRPRARLAHPDGLTSREVEVLGLLAHGLSNKQIAERLVVAPRTVGHHVAHIYTKIGVATRAGATLYAMRHDLLGQVAGS